MNWKLIFQLSLFGLAMAIGTVFLIPTNIEWIFWLLIFCICAFLIAKRAPGKYFLHGFVLALANCVWITAAHILLYHTYMENHPDLVAMNNQMPMPTHPRLMMLLFGPVVGIISGLVQGLFAFLAGKILKK